MKAGPIVRDEPKAGTEVGLAPCGSVVLQSFGTDETIAKRVNEVSED